MQFVYSFDEENPSSEAVHVTEYSYTSADTDCPDWFSLLNFDADEMTATTDEEDHIRGEMTPLPPDTKFRGRYTWTDREIDEDTEWQYSRVGGHVDPSVGRFLDEEETDDDHDFGNDPPANSEDE